MVYVVAEKVAKFKFKVVILRFHIFTIWVIIPLPLVVAFFNRQKSFEKLCNHKIRKHKKMVVFFFFVMLDDGKDWSALFCRRALPGRINEKLCKGNSAAAPVHNSDLILFIIIKKSNWILKFTVKATTNERRRQLFSLFGVKIGWFDWMKSWNVFAGIILLDVKFSLSFPQPKMFCAYNNKILGVFCFCWHKTIMTSKNTK